MTLFDIKYITKYSSNHILNIISKFQLSIFCSFLTTVESLPYKSKQNIWRQMEYSIKEVLFDIRYIIKSFPNHILNIIFKLFIFCSFLRTVESRSYISIKRNLAPKLITVLRCHYLILSI